MNCAQVGQEDYKDLSPPPLKKPKPSRFHQHRANRLGISESLDGVSGANVPSHVIREELAAYVAEEAQAEVDEFSLPGF